MLFIDSQMFFVNATGTTLWLTWDSTMYSSRVWSTTDKFVGKYSREYSIFSVNFCSLFSKLFIRVSIGSEENLWFHLVGKKSINQGKTRVRLPSERLAGPETISPEGSEKSPSEYPFEDCMSNKFPFIKGLAPNNGDRDPS